MRSPVMLVGAALLTLLLGCDTSPKSSHGFRLPDGDTEKGREAFVALQCYSCHNVKGVEMPPSTSLHLTLGGETTRVKTYGGLVTSIINPSHVVSEQYKEELKEQLSPMPEYNHVMTVQQMIDLVAFLQQHYTVVVPEPPSHYF